MRWNGRRIGGVGAALGAALVMLAAIGSGGCYERVVGGKGFGTDRVPMSRPNLDRPATDPNRRSSGALNWPTGSGSTRTR